MKTIMKRLILIILCCVPMVLSHAQDIDTLNRPLVVIDGVLQEDIRSEWPNPDSIAALMSLQPEEAVKQAVENDVHILGISSLAAGHLTLVPQVIEELKKYGREDIIVTVGGVIPAQDYDALYKAGAAAIFGPGTRIPMCVIKMIELLNAAREA